jgi:predicted nucleic acid-binding protein
MAIKRSTILRQVDNALDIVTVLTRRCRRGERDMLIGATALHHGFKALRNALRHFEMIPKIVLRKI